MPFNFLTNTPIGSNVGPGVPSGFENLLGYQDPSGMGLLGAAGAALSAGGRSREPVSLGQAIGNGLMGFAQAQNQARRTNALNAVSNVQLSELLREQTVRASREKALESALAGMDPKQQELYRAMDPGRAAAAIAGQRRVMTPDEMTAVGLPKGTVAERGSDGIHIVSKPDTMSAEAFAQKLDLAKQQAAMTVHRPQFGLTPFWTVDDKGNAIPFQLNNQGGASPVQLPPGVTAAGNFDRVDTGTEIQLVDKQTRQVVKTIPKNVAAEAAATAAGKAQGDKIGAAPNAIQSADIITQNLDAIEKHPGLSMGTGLTAWTGAIPGSPMYDFKERVEQIKGEAFLQAFEVLKGAGQITEVEGEKATTALARLKTAKSEKDFRQALTDFRGIVSTLRGRAQERLAVGRELSVPGMPPGTPATTSGQAGGRLRFNPATGQIE